MSLFWEKRHWSIFWHVDSFFGHALKFTKIVECCRKFGEMANITICLMVIADLAKSGRSVFSWAVIADLSFESLRFARWVFSHLSPLFSAVIRASSHFHLLVTSFHQKYSKSILFLKKLNLLICPQGIAILSYKLKKVSFCDYWIDSILMKAQPHVHVVTNVYGRQGHYRTLPDIGSNGGNDG